MFFDTKKPLFARSGATFALPVQLDPAITIRSESIIKFLSTLCARYAQQLAGGMPAPALKGGNG